MIFSPYILITLALFSLLILPHALWLISNMKVTATSLQAELGEINEGKIKTSMLSSWLPLFSALISFAGIWTLSMFIFFRKELNGPQDITPNTWASFFRNYLIVISILIITSVFVFRMNVFYQRYFEPFYIFLPVYFFLKIGHRLSPVRWNTIWIQYIGSALLILTFFVNAFPIVVGPYLGKPDHMNIPYDKIATLVKSSQQNDELILASELVFAGNLKLNLGKQKILEWTDTFHYREEMDHAGEKPVLVVWRAQSQKEEEVISSLGKLGFVIMPGDIRYVDVPYKIAREKTYKIGMVRVDQGALK